MKIAAIIVNVLLAAAYGNVEEENSDPEVDVIDGDDAVRNQFPYQISLQKRSVFMLYEHMCGGSIISQRWIVTAAHCTSDQDKDELRVVAGLLKLTDTILPILYNVYEIGISEIIVHAGYPGGQVVSKDDISLIKLATELTYAHNIKAVGLPSEQAAPGNATLSGWGYTNSNSTTLPNNLQYTIVDVIPNDECESLLTEIGDPDQFNSTAMICSIPQADGHQAQCSGDSGGPLVRNNRLIGIVSWHIGTCGTESYPSVLVNVATYTSWIKENT